MAAVVHHSDLIGGEALDGVGHEVADGVDLVGLEACAAHVDEHRGGRTDALVGEEESVFRLHDHHPRGADALQLGDGAGEFALDGTEVIGALDEVAEAELALVENLKTDAVATGQALAREIHADLVDLVGRDRDRAAARRHLVRDVLRLQVRDDGGGILVAQTRVKQLVIGPARPDHERDHAGGHHECGDDQRDALVQAELLPQGEQGRGEILHVGSERRLRAQACMRMSS